MSTLSTTFHWTFDKPAPKPSRIRGLFSALVQEIRIRRALREVSALDDTALFDIGISRGGIEDAVRHGRNYGSMTCGANTVTAEGLIEK